MHSAYDSVELIRGVAARVDAVGCYGAKILLGCSDCSLRIYSPESLSAENELATPQSLPSTPPFDHGIRKEPYVLERTVSGFWRKAPLAMEVSSSRDLLISLSEWITSHRLPNLETVAAISKTKGANAYSWDDHRGMLCVGRQKRVTIYRLDGGREFVEVKEFGVPDSVKSMAWCGDNICLGIRREYTIMNSITGALCEVFSSGRVAPPLVIPISSGELLLGKDNIGVFVDQNGKLLQDGRLCWSEAPSTVVVHRPYAVARLPRYVEIRSLRAPYQLVQTLVFRDVHLLVQSNNAVIATLGSSVYGLLPVPLAVQIVQLTASGDFEEALDLCKLLPPEDSNLRAAKEGSIHLRYGHYLFDNGSYEEAVEQFLASQVDVTYVLSLYPSLVLPKMQIVDDTEEVSEFTDGSLNSPDIADDHQTFESIDNSGIEARKMSHNALVALVKYLQKKRQSIIEKATAEVTEEVVSDAVHSSHSQRPRSSVKNRGSSHISSVAREMAAVLDTALIQALLMTGQSSAALDILKGPNYCDLVICEQFLQEKKYFAVLLELYKYNEMHREALKLLIMLVEQSNSEQRNSELTQRFRPEMIIEYLKPICAKDPMLVLEFSMCVLESCPTQTIELFLTGNIPADLVNSYLKQHAPHLQSRYLELILSMNDSGVSSNLQNELVQIYLSEVISWYRELQDEKKWDEKAYPSTRKKLLSALNGISGYNAEGLLKHLPHNALYEERAVLLGKMNQHQLALSLYVHKLSMPEAALAYCDQVYEYASHQSVSRVTSNIYLTLLQIYLNPRMANKEFEQRNFSSVSSVSSNMKTGSSRTKAGRLSKKIVEIEKADQIRTSPSSTDSGRSDGDGEENIETGPIMMNEALDLLNKRWERMNGAQALKLLPKETKIQDVLSFLEPLLKKSSECRRNYAVVKNLRISENLQVKEELYKHRKTGVKIDADNSCSLCRKRIGSSVFVIYPNRKTIVHFVCFRDSQKLRL